MSKWGRRYSGTCKRTWIVPNSVFCFSTTINCNCWIIMCKVLKVRGSFCWVYLYCMLELDSKLLSCRISLASLALLILQRWSGGRSLVALYCFFLLKQWMLVRLITSWCCCWFHITKKKNAEINLDKQKKMWLVDIISIQSAAFSCQTRWMEA